jgi:hypothetical protein
MKTLSLLISMLCFSIAVTSAKTTAVIEDWKRYLVLPSPNNLTIKEYVRIRILDEDGYGHAVFQDYYNAFKKIRSLRYTVIDAANKKVKTLTKMDALDVMMNASYEIGDARILMLDPQYRNFPFTVEIEVESSFNGFLDFPVWMPRYKHDLEVRNAEMVLECYKDFSYRSKEINGVTSPSIDENGKSKTIRWSVKELPALEAQLSQKSFVADQPKVHVTPLKFTLDETEGDFISWTNFGEWYRKLNEGRNELSPATKNYLDGLRKQYGKDTEGLSRAIYQYMQGKTRYVSIQLGIGGYQSIPSDEVERTGYGDCKALTNYMAAMLNYVYIPSNHVLVKAGRDVPDILPDFPSSQFNHVFLAVPIKNDTLWFECTSQTLPPAYAGTFTDDRYVLWIDKNVSKIIRTPAFDVNENIKKTHCVAKIGPQGDAELNLEVTQTGMFYDEVMYYEALPQDKIERFNYSKFNYKDFSLQLFNFSLPDKVKPVLNLKYKLHVNGLGKFLGDRIILPSTLLAPLESSFNMDLMNKKTEIRRPFTLVDSIQVVFPENLHLSLIPESAKESSEFGTFEIQFKAGEKNGLYIYRKAVIKKGIYEKETFGRLYDFLQKIKLIEQRKLVLQSKT